MSEDLLALVAGPRLAPRFALIASFNDSLRIVIRSGNSDSNRGGRRTRCFLAKPPWLAAMLEASDPGRRTGFQFCGAVEFEPGAVCTTVAHWPREAELLQEFYHSPLDAFFVKVKRVARSGHGHFTGRCGWGALG